MKIKLTLDCGYVRTDYEEEMKVNDDIRKLFKDHKAHFKDLGDIR